MPLSTHDFGTTLGQRTVPPHGEVDTQDVRHKTSATRDLPLSNTKIRTLPCIGHDRGVNLFMLHSKARAQHDGRGPRHGPYPRVDYASFT